MWRHAWCFALFATAVLLLSTLYGTVVTGHNPYADDENLALSTRGSVASASGAEAGHPAENANDGDNGTFWRCNKMNNCWLAAPPPATSSPS